jgi:HTH-type transcriptional regulator/antitoxin HigA
MATAVVRVLPSYVKLVRKFPLRVIGSESQYDAAVAMVQQLAMRGEKNLDGGEADYLYALASLVESYENEHYPIGPDHLKPHERLKWLTEELGMSQAKLGKLLSVSQPLVSLILLGKRESTVAHIQRLSEYFHINPRYFM